MRGSPVPLLRPSIAAAVALLLAVSPVVLPSTPAAAAGGDPSDAPALATARGAFAFDLNEPGDFVRQYTPYWCVGASMQMMLNIIGVTDDESRAAQERYMRVARSEGPPQQQVDHGQSAGGLRGAGSSGWASGLTRLGAGRYEERALDDGDEAVRSAALALRATSRPVGLVVWRGAHAWVMTGFTATSDPLLDPGFEVTGVFIQDPWYPRVSSIWGPGQEPDSWISRKALDEDFLPRRGGAWHAELAGKFVIVAPLPMQDPLPDDRRVL